MIRPRISRINTKVKGIKQSQRLDPQITQITQIKSGLG
jgi:hypothetical protein